VAKSSGLNGESIHFHAVRLRVNGGGNLDLTLRSLDSIRNSNLNSVVMTSKTNIEPTKLANFIEQRAQLEFGTDAIDEVFTISKIIIYIRPIATGLPG